MYWFFTMDVFEALELTEGEEKVYRALVALGESTTGPIYKQAKVSQSKVYEILERLKEKGLATAVEINNVYHWQPAAPNLYLRKIAEEKKRIEEREKILVSQLPNLTTSSTVVPDVKIFTGFDGVRNALLNFHDSLNKGDEYLVFSTPVPIPDKFKPFFSSLNKERARVGLYARFLSGEKNRPFAKDFYKVANTKIRYLKNFSPVSLMVGNDRIQIIEWHSGGRVVEIYGEQLARNYRVFFDELWDSASE